MVLQVNEILRNNLSERAYGKNCIIYGEGAASKSAAPKCFARLHSGNFGVKDEPCSGHPMTDKSGEFLEKVDQARHISNHDIANKLNVHHQTVLSHLQKTEYKKKLDVWVPHEFSVKSKEDRLNTYDRQLKRNEIEPSLKQIIPGEK